MGKFCSNCGAQIKENSKFCTSCGHIVEQAQPPAQQPQQFIQPPQYAQHTPTAQKKSYKKGFLFAGAGVLLVALIAAGVFTKGFGLFKNLDDTDDPVPTGATSNVAVGENGDITTEAASPSDTTSEENGGVVLSDDEKSAYDCVNLATSFYAVGEGFTSDGLSFCAEGYYALAGAAASAMRYAVDCLL